jgi:RNA polymerase sigma-70 factor (ECF subfamily)
MANPPAKTSASTKVLCHGSDLSLRSSTNSGTSSPGSLMAQEDSDLPLVQALQGGDDQALNALMDRHREGIFRFVSRQIHNEADALDLTMEAFVRAYFNIGKFRPTATFATWLYHIALNLCRDHARSRAYQYSLQTVSLDAPATDHAEPRQIGSSERRPDQKTERIEELTALEKAINELPADLKNAFILTTLDDRPQAETAELLGITLKAVGMRVYRARKLLLEKMSKMGF